MMRLPLLLALFGLPLAGMAQKVYVTDHEHQADVKVYVVDREYQADLLVYETEAPQRAKASENRGLWYFADAPYRADKKIYFTDREHRADLKICFVDREYRAGWKNRRKTHLMR